MKESVIINIQDSYTIMRKEKIFMNLIDIFAKLEKRENFILENRKVKTKFKI